MWGTKSYKLWKFKKTTENQSKIRSLSHEELQKRFLSVYDEHADAIYRHCYYRVFDVERAREMTQETFLRCWSYYKEGKADNPRALLYKIANNLVIDESRKRKEASLRHSFGNEVVLGADPDSGSGAYEEGAGWPSDAASIAAQSDAAAFAATAAGIQDAAHAKLAIMNMMSSLKPKERQVITMRYIEGMTHAEIAQAIGEKESAVSVRLHRALKKLKKYAEHI